MSKQDNQDLIIQEVLTHIAKAKGVVFTIIDKPDVQERNLPACDMIARLGNENLAVEQTSIDSVPNQRRDNSQILKFLFPLRDMLKNKLPTPGHFDLYVNNRL